MNRKYKYIDLDIESKLRDIEFVKSFENNLSPREMYAIKARLGHLDGSMHTYLRIGKQINMSQPSTFRDPISDTRAKQIYATAIKKIKKLLNRPDYD